MCGCGSQKSKLENYVTNYDEVITIIQDEFKDTNLKIKDGEQQSDEATMKQFGSGFWLLSVNDVVVSVRCEDHIACYVSYKTSTLGNPIIIYTPTYDQTRHQQNNQQNTNATEIINGGFSGYNPDTPVETVGTTADVPVVDGQ